MSQRKLILALNQFQGGYVRIEADNGFLPRIERIVSEQIRLIRYTNPLSA
jgi:hypothetical protein